MHKVRIEENDDDFFISILDTEKDYLTFAAVLSMRPIHRPLHELTIMPEVWDRMSPDEQKAARAEGKMRLLVRSSLVYYSFHKLTLFILLE